MFAAHCTIAPLHNPATSQTGHFKNLPLHKSAAFVTNLLLHKLATSKTCRFTNWPLQKPATSQSGRFQIWLLPNPATSSCILAYYRSMALPRLRTCTCNKHSLAITCVPPKMSSSYADEVNGEGEVTTSEETI